MAARSTDRCSGGFRSETPMVHCDCLFLETTYTSQRDVSDLLEAIADSLPGVVDFSTVKAACFMLESCWSEEVFEHEDRLFRELEKASSHDEILTPILRVLRAEHTINHDLVCELKAHLADILVAQRVREPEALGYMLRGVFVAIRRTVDLKFAVMMPATRRHLNAIGQSDKGMQQGLTEDGDTVGAVDIYD